jgi:outer membrane protein assembly factor BamB
VISPGSVIIASKYQGTIYYVDYLTGVLSNSTKIGQDVEQWLTVGADLKSVYVNAVGLNIRQIGGWTQTPGPVEGPFILGINNVLVARGGKFAYVFDPATGKQLFFFPASDRVESLGVNPDKFTGRNFITLAGGEADALTDFGAKQWVANPLQATSFFAESAGDGLFLSSVDGGAAAVNGGTGVTDWNEKLGSGFVGPPLVVRLTQVQGGAIRVVYISHTGHLYGLDAGGKTMWQQSNIIGGEVDTIPVAETP